VKSAYVCYVAKYSLNQACIIEVGHKRNAII